MESVQNAVNGARQYVQNTIGENFGGSASNAATGQWSPDEIPDHSGKVAVITGGSEGIGYACCYHLLKNNIKKVFILSVSQEVVDGAQKDLAEKLGQEAADKTKWIQCDLSDWNKVAAVSKQIRDGTDRLDILINNSARGIMTYQLDEHGIDRHMSVNHIAHVILTSHLLPLLKKTASDHSTTVRVVNLSSNGHESSPKDTKFASIDELNQDLGPQAQYGRSKLAQLLHMRYLTAHVTSQYPNILFNATHPGFVSTKMSTADIHEPYPVAGYAMSHGMEPFKKDQWEGAVSTLYAATATKNSGEYVCPPATIEPGSELSNNKELGEQLMKLTREIVAEKTDARQKGCPLKDYWE